MNYSVLGRTLVSGSMSPKPPTSNRGHSWAGRHRGPRGRVCRLFRGTEGPGSSRRGPASRVHGTCVSLYISDAKRVRARTWSCPRARSMKCPGRPNRPPCIPPPAGPIASWGRQHTSWVFGRLSASHARSGPICGPMHGHAQVEEACRVVEKKTRFMFRYRLKVDWGPDEASRCVGVA
jgi:hypothetical protein